MPRSVSVAAVCTRYVFPTGTPRLTTCRAAALDPMAGADVAIGGATVGEGVGLGVGEGGAVVAVAVAVAVGVAVGFAEAVGAGAVG